MNASFSGDAGQRAAPVGGWRAGVAFFLILLAAHNGAPRRPPYVDQAAGVWMEATYLALSDFDYWSLWTKEEHFMAGGLFRSYSISVVPTAIAVMLRTIGPTPAIVVCHVANIAAAALAATILLRTAARVVPVAAAWGIALAFLATPLVSAQTEMLGLDLPLAAATALCLELVARRRWGWAAVVSGAAFFIKSAGILVTLALLLYALLCRASRKPNDRPAMFVVLMLVNLLGVEAVLLVLADPSASIRLSIPWSSEFRWQCLTACCPDLLIVASLVGVGLAAARRAARRPGELPVALLGIALAIQLAFYASYLLIPRYLVVAAYLLFAVAPRALAILPTRVQWVIPWVVTLAGVLNFDGRYYPSLARHTEALSAHLGEFHERHCAFSERSLEYRRDQDATRTLVARIAELPIDVPTLAPRAIWTYLSFETLGYVAAPCDNAQVIWDAAKLDAVLGAVEDRVVCLVATPETRYWLPDLSADVAETVFRDGLAPESNVVILHPAQRDGAVSQLRAAWSDPTVAPHADRVRRLASWWLQQGQIELAADQLFSADALLARVPIGTRRFVHSQTIGPSGASIAIALEQRAGNRQTSGDGQLAEADRELAGRVRQAATDPGGRPSSSASGASAP